MKFVTIGLATAGLLATGVAFAQTTPSQTTPSHTTPSQTVVDRTNPGSDNNVAVATTRVNAPMPAKGSNSFTMGEAKSQIEKNGFSNVSGLTKDGDGIWHGNAQKGSKTTTVWLDYKGNVGESQ